MTELPLFRYATDGKCHNAEPGTFGHECGKPATWIGTARNGHRSGFCDDCKERGWEAPVYSHKWERIAKVYRCTVCGETPVDAENGFDTCDDCLKTRI